MTKKENVLEAHAQNDVPARQNTSHSKAMAHYANWARRDDFFRKLLVILLSVDAAFLVLYALSGGFKALGLLPELPSLQLNTWFGLASIWNYGKLILSVAVLATIWRQNRTLSTLVMLGLFLFLLVDDYFELHDHLGWLVGERLTWAALADFHPQNRGELVVYAVIFFCVVPLLWLALSKARDNERGFVRALTAGVLLIGLFGVAIDVLHGVLDAVLGFLPEIGKKILNRVMTIIEDGGEMVAMSICAWLCLVRLKELGPQANTPRT